MYTLHAYVFFRRKINEKMLKKKFTCTIYIKFLWNKNVTCTLYMNMCLSEKNEKNHCIEKLHHRGYTKT